VRDVKTTRLETCKEVAIVEKSIVKQCAFRVGPMPVCKLTLYTMRLVVQVTTVSCRELLQGLIDLQVGCPSRVQSVDLLLR